MNNMQLDMTKLRELEQQKLITIKQSINYPELYVVKYTKRVFYDNLWHLDPLLTMCRGLVIDASGAIIVYPFEKVFNVGESAAPKIDRDHSVLLVRKVNGFLGCVTHHPKYGWIYSTTGSLDSQFCDYIRDIVGVDMVERLHSWFRTSSAPITFMFEIVHPEDPHIIKEDVGAYLIGVRYGHRQICPMNVRGLATTEMVRTPEVYKLNRMSDAKDLVKKAHHEGFMIYDMSPNNYPNVVVKWKSPYYLFAKMCARKKDILNALSNIKQVKESIEEELYPLVDLVYENRYTLQEMDEQQRLEWIDSHKELILQEM